MILHQKKKRKKEKERKLQKTQQTKYTLVKQNNNNSDFWKLSKIIIKIIIRQA